MTLTEGTNKEADKTKGQERNSWNSTPNKYYITENMVKTIIFTFTS